VYACDERTGAHHRDGAIESNARELVRDRDGVLPVMEALKPQGEDGQAREGDSEKRPGGEEADAPGEEKGNGYEKAGLWLHGDERQGGCGQHRAVVTQEPPTEAYPGQDHKRGLSEGQP